MYKDKIKKDLYNMRYAIIILLIYVIFMQIIFSTVCPIKAIFGIDCPGCGLTHATIYMLTGRVSDAINANYTVFLWWGLIILFFIDRYIHKLKIKVFPDMTIVVAMITIIRYIIIISNKI